MPGDELRSSLLGNYGIEIGTSFGPLAGVVWRVGVMGYNARPRPGRCLAALERELRHFGAPIQAGGGVEAALAFYGTAQA